MRATKVLKLSVKAHDHMRSPTTFVNTLGAGCVLNVFKYIWNIDVRDAFKKVRCLNLPTYDIVYQPTMITYMYMYMLLPSALARGFE